MKTTICVLVNLCVKIFGMQRTHGVIELPTGREETTVIYKSDPGEPVAIRRIHPNHTGDTQAYSAMNEDPRVIYGLSSYSTTQDIDEELHQDETVGTNTMSPALELAIIGDSGVPEKYRGEVLGWIELLHDDPKYWKQHGFFEYPDEILLLDLIYSKRFFNWKEDLNTKELVGSLPTQRSSRNRKDLWFARDMGTKPDYDDNELHGVMESGVRQGIQLAIDMESNIAQYPSRIDGVEHPQTPRKIVLIASVKEGNKPSSKLLENLGFIKHPKKGHEDGEYFDIWFLEAN